jgi:hypothetical protein
VRSVARAQVGVKGGSLRSPVRLDRRQSGHARSRSEHVHEEVATARIDPVELGRWQRRILRVTLPAGIILLAAWILWLAVPTLAGGTRTDFTFPSGIIGLVTAAILIVTGINYRRSMAAADARSASSYHASRPHPFLASSDPGLAAIAAGGGFSRASGGQVDAVATTNRYQRMDGCAVPNCGRPRSAEIHAPAEH